MENSKRKRKRVQAKVGEVLTSADVIERFRKEGEERSKKKSKKDKTQTSNNASFHIMKSSKKSSSEPSKGSNKKGMSKKLEYGSGSSQSGPSRSSESDDEENVPCINCGKLYGEELKKLKPHWVSCDICTV